MNQLQDELKIHFKAIISEIKFAKRGYEVSYDNADELLSSLRKYITQARKVLKRCKKENILYESSEEDDGLKVLPLIREETKDYLVSPTVRIPPRKKNRC
jgi:hypothetical protein